MHGGSAGRNKMAAVCSGPAPLGPGIKKRQKGAWRHLLRALSHCVFFYFSAMTRGVGRRVEPEGSGGPVRGNGEGERTMEWLPYCGDEGEQEAGEEGAREVDTPAAAATATSCGRRGE